MIAPWYSNGLVFLMRVGSSLGIVDNPTTYMLKSSLFSTIVFLVFRLFKVPCLAFTCVGRALRNIISITPLISIN